MSQNYVRIGGALVSEDDDADVFYIGRWRPCKVRTVGNDLVYVEIHGILVWVEPDKLRRAA